MIWDMLLLLLRDVLWSGVASLGFAIMFNVPPRTLVACALCGALGHVTRTLLVQEGVAIEAATLAGAVLIGFLSEVFARRWRAPTPVFSVPGVIPLMPGIFAYEAMIGVLRIAAGGDAALLAEAATNAIKAVLILGALAVGVATPGLLFYRQQPAARP